MIDAAKAAKEVPAIKRPFITSIYSAACSIYVHLFRWLFVYVHLLRMIDASKAAKEVLAMQRPSSMSIDSAVCFIYVHLLRCMFAYVH